MLSAKANEEEIIATLHKLDSQRTASGRRKRMTAADLLNSDIVGMWSDRKDIEDSMAFARQLRQQVEHRQRDENASS